MYLKFVVNFEPVSVRYLLGASEELVRNSLDSNENSFRPATSMSILLVSFA